MHHNGWIRRTKRSPNRLTSRHRCALELLEPRQLLAANPIITEFMANNDATLVDGDRQSSDWVEIFNAGDETVDLAGWHLTDDADESAKWTFPSVELAPGEFLIVFTSGGHQDEIGEPIDPYYDAGGWLHANFKLDANGEYLALVKPDGETLASEFGPAGKDFPSQRDDISYGVAFETTTLIAAGHVDRVDVLIPAAEHDTQYGSTWTGGDEAAFAAAGGLTGWTAGGQTGVGFELGAGGVTPVAHYPLDDVPASDGTTIVATFGPDALLTTDNGPQDKAIDGNFGGALHFDGTSDSVTAPDHPDLNMGAGDLTLSAWFRTTWTPGSAAGTIASKGGAFASGKRYMINFVGSGQVQLTLDDDSRFLAFNSAAGLNDGNWHMATIVRQNDDVGNEAKLYIDGRLVMDRAYSGGSLDSPNGRPLTIGYAVEELSGNPVLPFQGDIDDVRVFDRALSAAEIEALYDTPEGFGELIGTDIETSMHGNSATAYLRIPFEVESEATFDSLSLRMKYADGFAAYLNGREVARRNAPGDVGLPPAFDAAATAERPLEAVKTFEEIAISEHLDALMPGGTNILAIHGMNYSADDTDFLIYPELVAGRVQPDQLRYFDAPTPAAANTGGLIDFVRDTSFSAGRGFYDAPFSVAITTATENATIMYTLDGSEPEVEQTADVLTIQNGVTYDRPITVTATTVLRAAAYKLGHLPTNVDTQTYVFLANVVAQNDRPPGFPTTWGGPGSGGRQIPANYELDPRVMSDPAYADDVLDAFLSLPTVSLVMSNEDWWDPATGVYISPDQDPAIPRELGGSVEYFEPDSNDEFQVDAGIRVTGWNSARLWQAEKMSLRLLFKDQYGPDQLDFPLFADTWVHRFDTLVLDAYYAHTWNYGQRSNTVANKHVRYVRAQYLRDAFTNELQLAMGGLAPHGKYVHLYINGLYWGLYNLHERPDASFHTEHVGGNREDWDVIRHNANNVQDGNNLTWRQAMVIANRTLPGGTPYVATPEGYSELGELVDLTDLADNIIRNLFIGFDVDWPSHNWYAARNRVDPGSKFTFPNWDAEHILKDLYTNRVDVNLDGSPARLYSRLRSNPEFRVLFGDRVHKHFFNGGALYVNPDAPNWDPAHPQNNVPASIYAALAEEIDKAIVLESARWGDTFAVVEPVYTKNDHWVVERDRLLHQYFPQRAGIVLEQFRDAGLYPTLEAPAFSQYGGLIPSGHELTISDPNSETFVLYTLDGTDPRQPEGGIHPQANVYGGAIVLEESTVLKARTYDMSTSQWSALNEAEFFVVTPAAAGNLAVTELDYHPHEPTPDELAVNDSFAADDFEFVELRNVGPSTIDLQGVRFTEGIRFDFSDGSVSQLELGEYVVVVKNVEAFQTRYGTSILVAGSYADSGMSLRNSGEAVALTDRFDRPIAEFSYDDSSAWPGRADGKGASLEVLDVAGNYDDPVNWRSGGEYGGSPGFTGTGPRTDVVVNEVLTHTDPPAIDTIELHNWSVAPVNIGGWFLSDTFEDYVKYRVSSDTVIPAGGYVTFDEDDFNPTWNDPEPNPGPNDFALNGAHGDDVWLMEADASGNLLHFVDHVDFGAAANGVSLGRWPNATGAMFPMEERTLGEENTGPLVGDVIISELHYHPAKPPAGSTILESELEFVELLNRTSAPVFVGNWRLDNGVEFTFAERTTIPGGGTMVVVGFNPADTTRAEEFRTTHNIDDTVPLWGPYAGRLENLGERVALARPDEPPADELLFVPYMVVDEVKYDDEGPWPVAAAGLGESLHRTGTEAFGNFVTNWAGGAPTPGSTDLQPVYRHPGDANLDDNTDVRDFNIWNAHKFTSGTAWTSGDFNGDGVTDVRDFNIWNAHKFTSASAPVDAVLEEAQAPDRADSAADLDSLAWLYDVEHANAGRRSSDDSSRAAAAVDKLLASYWP